MKFKLTLVHEFDEKDYLADSLVNDVGEIDDHITNDEATSAVRDAFMTGFIDALDILDPEYTDWRVEVVTQDSVPAMQAYLSMGDVEVKIDTADAILPLFPVSDIERIAMSVSPEQLAVWSAQLRLVASKCDELAEVANLMVCFPASGMVANDAHN